MQFRAASAADLHATVDMLVSTFSDDPLLHYLFDDSGLGFDAGARAFFTLLMQTRLCLCMPVCLAQENGQIAGMVMGYDTTRPAWPSAQRAEWDLVLMHNTHFAQRLQRYERCAEAAMPNAAHYYLGVLGTARDHQGRGVGRALVAAFCAQSDADARSSGVFLETASPHNLSFYRGCGFSVVSEDVLSSDARLWCLFRPAHPVTAHTDTAQTSTARTVDGHSPCA